jgi:hypothetical protein
MSLRSGICFAVLGAFAAQAAFAAPILTVAPGGISGGNRQWLISITPDATLFTNSGPSGTPPNTVGGSLSAELGFTVSPGSLISAVKNAANFPVDNPGNSPFPPPINGVQFGVVSSGNNVFAALGSGFFSTATPKQFLTISTVGSGATTLSWSGAYNGKGRIGQGGTSFDTFAGSVSVPEPASAVLAITGLAAVLAIGRRRRAV